MDLKSFFKLIIQSTYLLYTCYVKKCNIYLSNDVIINIIIYIIRYIAINVKTFNKISISNILYKQIITSVVKFSDKLFKNIIKSICFNLKYI